MNAVITDQRTQQPTDDILDVAAVVTGEARIHLTGWQRDHAIAAMTALGHSKTHIAWALHTTLPAVESHGRRYNITLHRIDQRPDWEAIRWVTHHGARMRLRGIDQIEAVRGLAARGHYTEEIARRLLCHTSAIIRIARAHGIDISPAPDPAGGWWAILQPRPKAVAA